MHRFFLPAVAAFALMLAIPAPVEAGGGGGIGGGGIGGGGPGGFSANNRQLSAAESWSRRLGRWWQRPWTRNHELRSRRRAFLIGLGGGRAPIGQGLTRGIGTPGGDDLHLGLSSRDLGLGNNFGLNLPTTC